MGCKNSTEKDTEEVEREEQVIAKQRYRGAPPARTYTTGRHPNCRPAEKKLDILDGITTKSGTLLMHSHPSETIECLFFYPEFSLTGQNPTLVPSRYVKHPKKLRGGPANAGGGTGYSRSFEFANPPTWNSIRCQFKEFDTLDDITKRWFEEGDAIPGVLGVESAGTTAAWATLSPHWYQQRWILPDGKRSRSFFDVGFSLPQRIYRFYSKEGLDLEKVKDFVHALNDALNSSESKLLLQMLNDENEQAADSIDDLRKHFSNFDADHIVSEMEDLLTEAKMGSYMTVRQIPTDEKPALQKLVEYLSFFEDCRLYNWFQVAIECTTEIGTFYYEKGGSNEPVHETSFADTLLSCALEAGMVASDNSWLVFEKRVRKGVNRVMNLAFSGVDEEDDLTTQAAKWVGELFPDLELLVNEDLDSIKLEMIGLSEQLGDPWSGTEEDLRQTLASWRQEDRCSIQQRRQVLYDRTVKEFESFVDLIDAAEDGSEEHRRLTRDMANASRIPRLMTKHFATFQFFLVFPIWDGENTSNLKRPQQAFLNLWPEGAPNVEPQRVEMVPFQLPDGGVDRGGTASDVLVKFINTGSDSIDTDDTDDPRNQWIDYDDPWFRGFQCQAPVTLDINYAMNFTLDGRIFLDHNSFFSVEEDAQKVHYRRVKFQQRARPMTLNPLKAVGLAL